MQEASTVPVFSDLNNAELVELIVSGAVGVTPTDTVYGLACTAKNKVVVDRLFSIKHRESKPGTVLAASIQQLMDLGLRTRYLKAVEHFWPNPVSVVVPCGDELAYLHRGLKSLAVRIPDDQELRAFLKQAGPLMTTSANLPGEPTAEDYQGAYGYFGDVIDFYVDMGTIAQRPPSTIVRIVDDTVEVLRKGAIEVDAFGRVGQGW